MHAKVALFDGQLLLGGSTNFVHSANQDNHELGVWLRGPVASQAQTTLDADWQNQTDPVAPMTFLDKIKAAIMNLVGHFE